MLQCLGLEGLLPKAINRSLEPVYLQDLQDLSVCNTVSTITFFLHHINFPPTTCIIIGCRYLNSVSSISPLLVPLKQLLSEKPHTLKLHHIWFASGFEHFDSLEIINLKFKGWVSSGPSSLEGYNPNFLSNNPDFTFFMRWSPHWPNVPSSEIGQLSVCIFEVFLPDDMISLSLLSYDPKGNIYYRPLAHKVGQLLAMNALYLSYISSTPFLQKLDCDVPQKGDDSSIPTYPYDSIYG